MLCSFASALPGDGDGAAAGERLLVPADPQDGQVQARQEEAAATTAGQARRRQLMSSDRAGDLQEPYKYIPGFALFFNSFKHVL